MEYLTVREVANKIGKSEETVKRKLRAGMYPNAYKHNDKKGWRIPESDLDVQTLTSEEKVESQSENSRYLDSSEDIIVLAYQIATLNYPSKEEIALLSALGLKHSMEILLVMKQSPKPVKNPLGFIRRAIKEGWSPTTVPKMYRKRQNLEERLNVEPYSSSSPFPFYNWLEGGES